MNLYTIVFTDDSVFQGGSLDFTKWQEIPDKNIRSIFYALPSGDCLALANFKRIYHFIEVTEDIVGKNKGVKNLESVNLLIERNNQILHYIINLKTKDIAVKLLDITDSIINQLNPIGWKKGI